MSDRSSRCGQSILSEPGWPPFVLFLNRSWVQRSFTIHGQVGPSATILTCCLFHQQFVNDFIVRLLYMRILTLAFLVILAGCTEMKDFYDGTNIVTVDSVEYMVRPLPGRTNAYHAVVNKPDSSTIFTADPTSSLGNIRAIEKFTGCKVIRETIDNREINTFAAVDCS